MAAAQDRVDELGRASRRAALLSLCGVAVVLLSLGYSAYQLRTLEAKKAALQQDIAAAQGQYDQLRANIEKVSNSLRITQQNEVYELKATCKATGTKTSSGDPVYNFVIYLNSPPDVLAKIEKVTYDFNHPSFLHPHRVVTDSSTGFATQWQGWGCLSPVEVTVYLKDGTSQKIDFDMCKSLGPDWS